MTSLVGRLRLADCKLDGRKLEDYADKLCKEAAAEITRLTAALETVLKREAETQARHDAALEKSAIDINVLDLTAMDAQRLLMEEVTFLRAKLKKAKADLNKMAALAQGYKLDCEEVRDVAEKMAAALEPLAKAGRIELCGVWRDDEIIMQTDIAYHVKFGHLRDADKSLTEWKGLTDEE